MKRVMRLLIITFVVAGIATQSHTAIENFMALAQNTQTGNINQTLQLDALK